MTDQPGPWRPAPAKPSSRIDTREILRVSSTGPTTRPSAAIRGAAQAFLAKPAPEVVKTNTGSTNGARAAASGARKIVQHTTGPRSDTGNHDTMSLRGRQPGPAFTKSPAANPVTTSLPVRPQPTPPARSASAIAAKLASASSSPVRNTSRSPGQRQSPHGNLQTKSPAPSANPRPKSPLPDLPESAPSKSDRTPISAPRPLRPIPLTANSRPVLDFGNAPVLSRNTSSDSSQSLLQKRSPNAFAQAAARYASPVASPFELQERTSYLPTRKIQVSPSVLDSDLSSPLLPSESRSTAEEGSRKSTLSQDPTAPTSPPLPKTAPIPIRNTAPRKIPPKPSPISGQLKDSRTGLTDSTLADAIVASSVASSRASSPSKRPPIPPRRSRSHSILHRLHHESVLETKYASTPIRPMKQTLRKKSKPDDDEDETGIVKRGRRHFVRKHPNKHHEGDRKRWRDKVTERERKRYEGVWAANRGLYVFWDSSEPSFGQTVKPADKDDMIVNVVVREIWERSRLPKDNLEEIWDLVAPKDAKSLGRWEFVVGMWLIDQRLKGRKLPTRVSQSVWASVRNNIGLKVSSKPLQ